MKKRILRKIAIGAGIMLLVVLAGNFGLNLWLKYQLPDFIKKNTDYLVSYKTLKVDVGTGNIFATQVHIGNKNPQNEKRIRIQGKIDSLQVSRFGIWKLIFDREITSDNIQLSHPDLEIVLARPAKKLKRRNTPLEFEHISISKGNIRVMRFDGQMFFSAESLSVQVENLQLTEASMEKEFPVVFDHYSMSGNHIFLRPDEVYLISAASISTENHKISISDFKLTPQISYPEFLKRFPKKRNLFNIHARGMSFRDMDIKKKKLTLSEISLSQPDITMFTTQEKPGQKKKSFSQDVSLQNLRVRDAGLRILKPDSTRLFAVQKLNMEVSNMRMDDETAKGNIPFAYDHFKITGQQLNYISDRENVSVQAAAVNEKSADLRNILIRPSVTQSNKTLMDLATGRISLAINSWGMQNDKIHLDIRDILIDQISGNIRKGAPKTVHTKANYSKIQFPLKIQNFQLKNAAVSVQNHDGSTLFSGQKINAKAGGIEMNENTIKNSLPFLLPSFELRGQNLVIGTQQQNISILAAAVNQKSGDFRQIKILGKGGNTTRLNASQVSFVLNKWAFLGEKMNLDVRNISVDGMKGKFAAAAKSNIKKKQDYSRIAFPLNIRQVNIRNSDIVYSKGGQPLALKNLNASFAHLVMDAESVKNGIPFRTGSYQLNSSDFQYQTKYYNLSIGSINVNQDEMNLKTFRMKPRYSRSQFIRQIPVEQDLYTISANSVTMKGKWNMFSSNPYINAQSLVLDKVNANIFRSKIPKDDPRIKPLYSEALRKIKLPLYIATTQITDSYLEYEEDTPTSDGPGKLTFSNFSLVARNINSAKTKGKPTTIPIAVTCRFFNVSPMQVQWNMNTASPDDAFTISGNFNNLPAAKINQFVEPYMKIRTSGTIENLNFNFHGNRKFISGVMKMKHQNLKVSILRSSGNKNKVLSAIANVFVKSNSGDFPASVNVENVERDPAKSFFNLFWKGIQDGLTQTLLGKKVGTVKSTVSGVKTASQDVKKAVNSATGDVKDAVKSVTSPEETPAKKKKGVLNRIFSNKKERQN